MTAILLDSSDDIARPDPTYTTLEALAADDWTIAELESEIRATLAQGETYVGGGGAAGVFRIHPVDLSTLDSACASIQSAIGQDDGGVAGMVFCGTTDAAWAALPDAAKDILLRQYLAVELSGMRDD